MGDWLFYSVLCSTSPLLAPAPSPLTAGHVEKEQHVADVRAFAILAAVPESGVLSGEQGRERAERERRLLLQDMQRLRQRTRQHALREDDLGDGQQAMLTPPTAVGAAPRGWAWRWREAAASLGPAMGTGPRPAAGQGSPIVAYRHAGPRRDVAVDPARVHAAVVTCGGLYPGLNTVLREFVVGLQELYGIRDVFRVATSYRGFYGGDEDHVRLNPAAVDDWHKKGGTVLKKGSLHLIPPLHGLGAARRLWRVGAAAASGGRRAGVARGTRRWCGGAQGR